MAELKTTGRMIGQPNAPDLKQATAPFEAISFATQSIAKTTGEYVKATRKLEEKALIAQATNDFEQSYIKYKNNPNINIETLKQFQTDLDAKINGISAAVPYGSDKEFLSALEQSKASYYNKALDATLKQSLSNEIRDISLSITDYQDTYVNQIQNQDYDGALKTKSNLAEMLHSLYARGVSAKELTKISQNVEVQGIAAEIKRRLKNASTKEERNEILREVAQRPDTPVNVKAFTEAYKEATRLNKLTDEANDLAQAWKNIQTGNNWDNRELDAKDADKLVDMVSKNISAHFDEAPATPRNVPTYQAMPAYKGQAPTYDYEEELAAEREGRKPNLYLRDSLVQTEEAPAQRAPSLFELAEAHALVGSKYAKQFPKAVRNRLYGGNGQQANEAVTALKYVEDKNPASIDLDAETDMLYTEFKAMRDSGRTDYDQMILESRDLLNKSKANIKINSEIYNSTYSTTSTKGLENLNKAFKEATGVDALKTGSTAALNDFGHVFKSKFLIANGRYDNAIESAKRQMERTHGEDMFTGGNYVNFPPTKMLQGLDETQISNQILLQIVNHADKGSKITYPEIYNRIKTANEYDRMNVNLASRAVQPSKKVPERFRPGIEITQNIEGLGNIKGTVFLKPNELTDQNNSGMPVWEAWIKDDTGREFPIIDDESPYKNQLLIFGKTAADFAPNYTKNLNDEKVQQIAEQVLADEGKKLYKGTSWSPLAIIDDYKNYQSYKAYINDEANKERVTKKVEKILGRNE